MYKVDNAIIMAAGTSSRFAPLSFELPKALIEVKGEVLIERQIKQLLEVGIKEIVIVTGYKHEQFEYLKDQYNVVLLHNKDYLTRNNHASIYVAKDYLKNSYICSADNYFTINPFENKVDCSYYSSLYADGETKEWCLKYDSNDFITDVKIGGYDSWYMLGHTFWDETFSKEFMSILEGIYDLEDTKDKLWESIYMEHIDTLKMKIRKYNNEDIFEFDTLDELRLFDHSYYNDTRSKILKDIALKLQTTECNLINILAYKDENNAASGFTFMFKNQLYKYSYLKGEIELL